MFAVGYWYLMPKGFPVSHIRFWINSVCLPFVGVACALGLFALFRKHETLLKCLVLIFGITAVGAGITATFLFPESVSGVFLMLVIPCSILGVLPTVLIFWSLKSRPVAGWLKIVCLCVGLGISLFLPWSQRGADPATTPMNLPLPAFPTSLHEPVSSLALSETVTLFPQKGEIRIQNGETALVVYPLLTFSSRSPDRFWTIFAPPTKRVGPPRSLIGLHHEAGMATMAYDYDGRSVLHVRTSNPDSVVNVESFTELPYPVYSHLNAFTMLRFAGKETLNISFSPCPELIEIRPADYPFGRPARLAYLDAEHVLRVVEAHDAEKGPFRTLAKGKLNEDEPLHMMLYDGKNAVCRVTFHDWAKQASTQLSPTAGWSLPENALQFLLHENSSDNEGFIVMTLAGTGIGRGWDSVGHAAGIYRNSMTISHITR